MSGAKPPTPLDDLHIDEVDDAYKDRSKWLEGAVACLEAAISIRDARNLQLTVALGMSLRSSALPLGVNFSNWTELERELDDSPPSLYLWTKEQDQVDIHATRVTDLTRVLVVPTTVHLRKLFSEWCDTAEGEFRRTIWLIG
ncbi:MAG: hypothetical protein ACREJ4_02190 [Candidatus Methylomirabilaceae bacterium]